MIIPWRVDVPQNRWPFCNWLILAGIILAFALQMSSISQQKAKIPAKIKEFKNQSLEDMAKELGVDNKELKKVEQAINKAYDKTRNGAIKKDTATKIKKQLVKTAIIERYFVWGKIRPFILDGSRIEGFLGHIWLHGGIVHLIGNLLFLWIFGNAVCAKIGNVIYFPIYLGFGLLAAVTHLLFVGGPMIGASGAIMGIVGMYLVFFPVNDITCYFIYYFRPHEFTISSYWMILFWLAFDILGAVIVSNSNGSGGVAYFAHLGGFFGGVGLAVLMLKTRWVQMERYEKSLLQVFKGRNEAAEDMYGSNHSAYPYQMEMEKIAEEKRRAKLEEAKDKVVEIEPLESEIATEEFVRFVCSCGKRIKVPIKYAGRSGKCPRCKTKVRVPEI